MAKQPAEGRTAKGRFAPGNPGRRPGVRNKATIAAEAMLEGDLKKLTRKAVQMALAGDTAALRLCMERVLPPRKDRPIRFALPSVVSATDHPAALAAIMEGVASGELTPSEAQSLSGVLEQHRRALETADLETRVRALEGTK